MNSVFGALAAVGFVLALIVHGMTCAGIDVTGRFPAAWLLHLGIFVVFLPFVFALRAKQGTMPRTPWGFFADRPAWVQWLAGAAFIYTFFNFFTAFQSGGTPDIRNGEYVLHNHGRIIRHLTEAEYHQERARVARGFSGHWLLFYLIPALYFLAPVSGRREELGSGTSQS